MNSNKIGATEEKVLIINGFTIPTVIKSILSSL